MAIRTLSALVAACHDASCRPPTSGGTGGSRKGSGPSAPRGGKAPKLNAAHAAKATPRYNETEFTKKVRAAIEAEPALQGRRTLAEHHDALNMLRTAQAAEQRTRLMKKLSNPNSVNTTSHADIQVNVVENGYARTIPANDLRKMSDAIGERIRQGEHRRFITDPNAEPKDAIDKILKDFVTKRLNAKVGDSVYFNAQNPEDSRTSIHIHMGETPLRKSVHTVINDPAVTPEFELAANRVGRMVHEEFQSRVAAKVQAEEATVLDRIRQVSELTGVPASKLGGWMDADGVGSVWVKDDSEGHTLSPEMKVAAQEKMKELGLANLNMAMHMGIVETRATREVFDQVLSEARSAGGLIDGTPGDRKPQMGMSSNAQVLIASSKYPTDWITASNSAGSVSFKPVKHRAHYSNKDGGGNGEITLDGNPTTAVHELGHRMEYTVPGLFQLEEHFYNRRTAGESEMPLNRLLPGHGYGSGETSRPDELFHVYAGKRYKDAFELMTMGMQAVSRGDTGSGARHEIDPDHAGLVWGALVTLLPGGNP